MKKKIPFVLMLTALLTFSACSQGSDDGNQPQEQQIDKIHEIYLTYRESGGTLSYEAWLASIKGEKGEKGADGTSIITGSGVPGATMGKSGDVYINLTNWDFYVNDDGNWIVYGNIKGKDGVGTKGEQGDPGQPGAKGDPGKDATTYIPCLFYNDDGEKLYEFYYEKGSDIVYDGPTPTKQSQLINGVKYNYTFSGWDHALTNIQAPTRFTAQYTEQSEGPVSSTLVLNTYDVTLEAGGTFELYASGATEALSWTANEENFLVTKLSDNRLQITALRAGISDDIVVYTSSQYAICSVTVNQKQVTPGTISIELTQRELELTVGDTATLDYWLNDQDATLTWSSSNEGIIDLYRGDITALAAGTTTVTVTASKNGVFSSDRCVVTVKEPKIIDSSIYDSWSQPGHLYFHYLRNENTYDRWALAMWQNFPQDLEASLWGANSNYPINGVSPYSYGYMTKAQCGGSGTDPYIDEQGQIIDVNLADPNVTSISGKSSPLVSDWSNIERLNLGFLVIDQTKSTGKTFISDGGAETFIKKIGQKMTAGIDGYIHIYCIEGEVSDYKWSVGGTAVVNPTIDDATGQYRSRYDMNYAKTDRYTSGVATSKALTTDNIGVGYHIVVPSFADSDGDKIGDLRGIQGKLPYLKSLGVGVISLSPIFKSKNVDGTGVLDFYQVDPRYGSQVDLTNLINAANQQNIKVMLQMDVTQVSTDSELFAKSSRAEVETVNGQTVNYRDMFTWKYKNDATLKWDENPPYGSSQFTNDNPATYRSITAQENSTFVRYSTSDYYYYQGIYSGMAKLNYLSPETTQYIKDMCGYWLDLGIYGFNFNNVRNTSLIEELSPQYQYRQDYIIYDLFTRTYYDSERGTNVTAATDFSYDRDLVNSIWKNICGDIKSEHPNCYLIGDKFDGWNERVAPTYKAFDSLIDYASWFQFHEIPIQANNNMGPLANSIAQDYNYYFQNRSDAINAPITSDLSYGRMLNHYASNSYLTNNEDINQNNKARAYYTSRWAAALTILMPGISWITYGDELGMSGNTGDSVTDSSGTVVNDHGTYQERWYKQPMKWSDTRGSDGVPLPTYYGFESLWDSYNQSLDNVTKQEADSNSMLNYFKGLIALKSSSVFPKDGKIANYWTDSSGALLALQVTSGSNRFNIFINAGSTPITIENTNTGTYLGGSSGATATSVPAYGYLVVQK